MGIETLIALAVGGTIGGTISKASGGSFWKGAAMGALTGGVGVAADRLTGGNLTGKKGAGKGGAVGVDGTLSSSAGGASTEEEKTLRNRERSLALLSTSPSGVLGNAMTGRRTLLGN